MPSRRRRQREHVMSNGVHITAVMPSARVGSSTMPVASSQEVIMAVPPAQPAEEKGPFFVREHLVVRWHPCRTLNACGDVQGTRLAATCCPEFCSSGKIATP